MQPDEKERVIAHELPTQSSSGASSVDGSEATSTTVVGEKSKRRKNDGQWSEEEVDVEAADAEFEGLRQTLSRLSRRSRRSARPDEETGAEGSDAAYVDLDDYLTRHDDLLPRKHIGVSFRNVTVRGSGCGWVLAPTFPAELAKLFGWGLVQFARERLFAGAAPPTKDIISDFSGVVRAGEMLLVLGRPGSGSSTLLGALTNQRRPGTEVAGDIRYGGLPYDVALGRYRGEILLNSEDDMHLATLTVDQTLKFALQTKTPRRRTPGTSRGMFVEQMRGLLLDVFKMRHVRDTIVGSAYVRGVSGGERKRVSIMEALAARATVNAWDNSTRGLDHVSALNYIRSLKILNKHTASTTIVTLYQPGEGIFAEFDKVCLVDQGRQIYFGPAAQAKAYFEGLGFECAPRVTTAEFLTTITDPNGRRIRPGWEDRAPRTPAALEAAFRASTHWKALQRELAEYEASVEDSTHAADFKSTVVAEKSRTTRNASAYTVSFFRQVAYLTQREFMLMMQNMVNLRGLLVNTVFLGLLSGGMYYQTPVTSQGAFLFGGITYTMIYMVMWMQIVEAMGMTVDRAIWAKQGAMGFYRPSAVVLAKSLADVPLVSALCLLFAIIVYWMAGLRADAGSFFIQNLFIITVTIALTGFYRMIGAFSKDMNVAIRYSFFGLNVMLVFAGYMQPYRNIQHWVYKWIYWANPIAYTQEALMARQFTGRDFTCSPQDLVPNIPGANIENQVCNLAGSVSGSLGVSGDRYLDHFDYKASNIWRNYGLVLAFTVAYIAIAMIGVEFVHFNGGGGSVKVLAKKPEDGKLPTRQHDASESVTRDEKKKADDEQLARTKSVVSKMNPADSIFTWSDVSYTIDGKQLLNNMNGFVKPGRLTALMGSSGAGKTTLLDTLSMRKRTGEIGGEILLDGKPRQPDFERSTAFVEQQDVHDWSQTVREALRFSAMLRQPATVSKEEKYAFVEELISLLELDHLADALIGHPGAGLSIEERKRVTIGVELASAPSALMFLDEPTSGLDSTGALSLVRFLRKLADESHIAILCTIHQPSPLLFQAFDDVLLISGGEEVYFGPTGPDGQTVMSYFQRHGAPAPPADINPAEYILESTADSRPGFWAERWAASPEYTELRTQISSIIEARAPVPDTRPLRTLTYAMPLTTQIAEVTRRTFTHFHRDPSYGYSKIFSNLGTALILGAIYYHAGPSVSELSTRAFAIQYIGIMGPMLFISLQPKYLELMALYETRERSAKIYSFPAWITGMLLAELPYAVLQALFFWLPWYYMIGFPAASARAGYSFLLLLLFQLWVPPMAMWVAAAAGNMTIISVVNPFIFVAMNGGSGIMIPWEREPSVFKYFFYWVNPMTWFVRGMTSNALSGLEVECADDEWVTFYPPAGETCAGFAGEWLETAAGYLRDVAADGSAGCDYCPLRNGDMYLRSINAVFDERWRDLGLFAVYVVSNTVLAYAVYWAVREVRWGQVRARWFGRK